MFNAQYSTSNVQLKQDPDVLDTWFSSWLWPMEVFKGSVHPGNEDIKYYYPTSVLVTGPGYHFLLGSKDDHGRYGIHERKTIQRCILYGDGA
jgi:valyl-tRNA synthetase